jgi:hypothetical protein
MGIQQMLMGGELRPSLPTSVSAIGTDPAGTAKGSVALLNTGVMEKTQNLGGGTTTVQNWLGGAAAVGLYEARYTILTGPALDIGTAATWQSLSTSREWGYQTSTLDNSGTGTLEIRRAATGTVMATCAVTMEADGS